MAQQNINVGSGELKGDGESIRSAFQKINSNFTELYNAPADPLFSTSTAASITATDISNWNTAHSWGDHSIRGYLTGTVSQHILPNADAAYDLGSTSSQWRSLYVSTNTIYIGGTSLSLVNGNLTIDGISVQSQITGNVEFRNDSLNSLNGITISNASQTTAATAQITVPANGSGSVSITNSGTSWAFGNDGSLTFPDGSIQTTAARATTSTLFNGTFTFSLNSIGDLTLPTGWRISSNRIDTGLGTTVTSISLVTESLYTDRRLEIYSESNRLHLDTQSPTTELYIGDNSQFIALKQNGEIVVSGQNGVSIRGQGENSTSRIVIPGNTDSLYTPVFIINTGSPGVMIQSGATPRNWQFRGSDGALVFPDDTVQTTAWTGSAPTGTITFSTDTLRNTTSLGGRVQIQTASQQGDPAKTWSFDHGGAGSLILTEGSSIRAKHGFNILATKPEFVNFTSIRNFDSLSFLDLTNIVIINPTADILASIDPSTSTCVAVTGTTVRLMLDNGIVKKYRLTSTFVGEQNNPYYGLPVWTGTIPNSGIASTSIKEVSIEYSANWRFDTDGRITFPDGTTSTGATIFANSSSYKIQTISFDGSPSNVVSTYEFGVSSITIPGNGTIRNEGQPGYWGLDGANGQLTFPNNCRISYGLINAGLTEDDLKIQAINTGNVVISASGEDWVFATDGNLTFPDYTIQTTAYQHTEGSWTLSTGSNTVSFTVPGNGTYSMWVRGNIPNGIVVWNANVTVTNSNVPVIGQQFAWNYTNGGSPILITAIPDQIIGTAGSIITTNTYVGSTANTFTFGISNSSGASQVVYWGYTKI